MQKNFVWNKYLMVLIPNNFTLLSYLLIIYRADGQFTKKEIVMAEVKGEVETTFGADDGLCSGSAAYRSSSVDSANFRVDVRCFESKKS